MRFFRVQKEEHERQHSDQHRRADAALLAASDRKDKICDRGTLFRHQRPERGG